ncbi:MAG: NYN domain-containing protein, partial [Clostridiales bacterium]|nr:NYN domain-containing protein [Clostridiales bacterium]
MPLENLRLAVLIDADNAPRKNIKGIMEEIAIYGTPTIKRIYGDWTSPNLASWKKTLLQHAINPVQQYGYTVGKNSTDSAMIIDAMDVLYSGNVDGFVIVSSDSDFTRLATRLREAGMTVIGIGEKKTPAPFIVACDKFIYIEIINAKSKEKAEKAAVEAERIAAEQRQGKDEGKGADLKPSDKEDDKPSEHQTAPKKSKEHITARNSGKQPPENAVPEHIVELIADSIADIADEDGYA